MQPFVAPVRSGEADPCSAMRAFVTSRRCLNCMRSSRSSASVREKDRDEGRKKRTFLRCDTNSCKPLNLRISQAGTFDQVFRRRSM
jgi:hypothetical protein